MNNIEKKYNVLLKNLEFSQNYTTPIDFLLFDTKHSKVMEELLEKKIKKINSNNANMEQIFNNNYFKSFHDSINVNSYKSQNTFCELNQHDIESLIRKYGKNKENLKEFRRSFDNIKIEDVKMEESFLEIATRVFNDFLLEFKSQCISYFTDLINIFISIFSYPPFNCLNLFDVLNTFVLLPTAIFLIKTVLHVFKSPSRELKSRYILTQAFVVFYSHFVCFFYMEEGIYRKFNRPELVRKIKNIIRTDDREIYVYDEEKAKNLEKKTDEYNWALFIYHIIAFPCAVYLHHYLAINQIWTLWELSSGLILLTYYVAGFIPWVFSHIDFYYINNKFFKR